MEENKSIIFKAVLVDDEQSARNVLHRLLLRHCPNIEILAEFGDVLSAVEGLKTLRPDVVFLDVQMPNYAGYELLNFVEEPNFEVIFVTAYDQYALKAFEVSALDYLLKPLEVERLKQAVERLRHRLSPQDRKERLGVLREQLKTDSPSHLIVWEKGYQYKIPLENIAAFEAQEAYTTLYAKEGRFTMSRNIKHYEELLQDSSLFFRCHKSWLINLNGIERYSRALLEISLKSGLKAKLSKYRKADFERIFNGSSSPP